MTIFDEGEGCIKQSSELKADQTNLALKDELALFPFRKTEVDKLNNPAHYARVANTSAYVQLRTKFESDNLKVLLDKLSISQTDSRKVLLFGGFTGQYGDALRNIGYNVIFTDVLPEWVEQAKTKGFEAYEAKAEDIPVDLQKDVDFYTTFECYGPLCGGSPLKIIMEAVGKTAQGLVFVENEQALNNEDYNHHGTLIASLDKIRKIYSINILEADASPLHGIRVFAEGLVKETLSDDLVLLRVTDYLMKKERCDMITPYGMSRLLERDRPEFTEERVKEGIERIVRASK